MPVGFADGDGLVKLKGTEGSVQPAPHVGSVVHAVAVTVYCPGGSAAMSSLKPYVPVESTGRFDALMAAGSP